MTQKLIHNRECLYDWFFHYCPYTDEWRAFHREHYNLYWNSSTECESLIKSKKIVDLEILIVAFDGDYTKFKFKDFTDVRDI